MRYIVGMVCHAELLQLNSSSLLNLHPGGDLMKGTGEEGKKARMG